jgi:diguanylate cyclase (GGDEF)-like protein
MTRQDIKKVLIISNGSALQDEMRGLFAAQEDVYAVQTAESSLQALDRIYSDPPDLVMLDQDMPEDGWQEFCQRMKADMVFGHFPIVLVLGSERHSDLIWENIPIDDYLCRPLDGDEAMRRVSLIFARAARVRDANPLTGLPGNYSIMKQIQSRINSGQHFEVAYVDLDNFKSLNDRYGFLRGDEIIKITARLLTNSVRKSDSPEAFVGHVGGDDFVFIVPPRQMDRVCREIISNFDLVVSNFYDEEDRARRAIVSTNRKGEIETFPFVSVSIAIVTNERRPIKHIGEVSAIAAEVKKLVKSMPGSNYHRDLRGSGAAHS